MLTAAYVIFRAHCFTRAVQEFLATRAEQNITPSDDAGFADNGKSDIDQLRREVTRRALLDVEWE